MVELQGSLRGAFEALKEADAILRAKNAWEKAGLVLPSGEYHYWPGRPYLYNDDNPQVSADNFVGWDRKREAAIRISYNPASTESEDKHGEIIIVSREVEINPERRVILILKSPKGGKPSLRIEYRSGSRSGGASIENLNTPDLFADIKKKRFSDEPDLAALFPDEGSLDIPATMKTLSDPKIDRSKPGELLHLVVKKK